MGDLQHADVQFVEHEWLMIEIKMKDKEYCPECGGEMVWLNPIEIMIIRIKYFFRKIFKIK